MITSNVGAVLLDSANKQLRYVANRHQHEIWSQQMPGNTSIQDALSSFTTPVFIIDNNGNVGIGYTNPDQKLSVNGTVQATYFVGDGSGLTNISGTLVSTSSSSSGTSNIYYKDGNIGIGTTSPLSTLDVAGTLNATSSITSGAGLFVTSGDVIVSSGNIGVRKNNPIVALDVLGSISATGQLISTVSSETSPLQVTSSNLVQNLNADKLDGEDGSFYRNANNINAGTLDANRLPLSGVTSGSYGNSSNTVLINVDATGRITNASTSSIQIAPSQVSGLANVATSGNYNDLSNKTFVLNNTSAVFTTGSVGIGKNNPQTTLDIDGSIQASGNIGIGTSSLKALRMHIHSGNSGQNITGAPLMLLESDGTSSAFYVLQCATLGGGRSLSVTNDGNVGIGTANPTSKLHVSGNMTCSGDVFALDYTATTASGPLIEKAIDSTVTRYGIAYATNTIRLYTAQVANNTINLSLASGAGTYQDQARIDQTGNLIVRNDISGFSSSTLSDARLKEDVHEIQNGLKIVKQLRPVSYVWKQNVASEEKRGTYDVGFIAQEIENVLPHIVKDVCSIDEGDQHYKTINYDRVIPYLTKAVHELQDMIYELQQEMQNLKNIIKS